MELHTEAMSFKRLLIAKKKYVVPRFQREFSWGPEEIKEMYYDIFKRLKKNNESGIYENTEYFFGNILLHGDMDSRTEDTLFIIDGQQRMTSVTIFLSALRKKFTEINEQELADAVWEYVMARDDDGKQFAIFNNLTPYPYFQYKVQSIGIDVGPKSEEEDRIRFAYDYFYSRFDEKTIKKDFHVFYNDEIGYIDCLKLLRDQLLKSYIICSWAKDYKYVNLIFEILNAKGKELETIDIIKNDLFEKLDKTEPVDYASLSWKRIHSSLYQGNLQIPFSTYYRHFWSTQYGKSTGKKLWDNYKKNIKTKDDCKLFLQKMELYAKYYAKVVKSSLEDFDNKHQFQYIVDSLNNLSMNFNIEMSRIILMVLWKKYSDGLIGHNVLGSMVLFIEKYHFIYNAVCSQRTNKLDKIYSTNANLLDKANTKDECLEVIEEFKKQMKDKLPTCDSFCDNIKNLKYSKEYLSTNLSTKYLLNEIERIYSSNNNFRRPDHSIEHIFGEQREQDLRYNNLLLIEASINSSIPKDANLVEKIEFYKKSNYSFVKYFISLIDNDKNETSIISALEKAYSEAILKVYQL